MNWEKDQRIGNVVLDDGQKQWEGLGATDEQKDDSPEINHEQSKGSPETDGGVFELEGELLDTKLHYQTICETSLSGATMCVDMMGLGRNILFDDRGKLAAVDMISNDEFVLSDQELTKSEEVRARRGIELGRFIDANAEAALRDRESAGNKLIDRIEGREPSQYDLGKIADEIIETGAFNFLRGSFTTSSMINSFRRNKTAGRDGVSTYFSNRDAVIFSHNSSGGMYPDFEQDNSFLVEDDHVIVENFAIDQIVTMGGLTPNSRFGNGKRVVDSERVLAFSFREGSIAEASHYLTKLDKEYEDELQFVIVDKIIDDQSIDSLQVKTQEKRDERHKPYGDEISAGARDNDIKRTRMVGKIVPKAAFNRFVYSVQYGFEYDEHSSDIREIVAENPKLKGTLDTKYKEKEKNLRDEADRVALQRSVFFGSEAAEAES